MSRQKRIFLIIALFFFAAMAYVAYDISRRTTFPGSKPQLQERIKEQFIETDSVQADSVPAVDTVIQR